MLDIYECDYDWPIDYTSLPVVCIWDWICVGLIYYYYYYYYYYVIYIAPILKIESEALPTIN